MNAVDDLPPHQEKAGPDQLTPALPCDQYLTVLVFYRDIDNIWNHQHAADQHYFKIYLKQSKLCPCQIIQDHLLNFVVFWHRFGG